MKADNEFLMVVADKLNEITERTNDIETAHELDEFVQVIIESLN
ncbi:hypothetical protein [Paenibacillus sp. FSL H3-0286]